MACFAAITAYKQECLALAKSSVGQNILKGVAAVALAAVAFVFVAGTALAIGLFAALITLPTGPGIAAGVMGGVAAGASWAIGILSSAGVVGLLTVWEVASLSLEPMNVNVKSIMSPSLR